MTCDDARSRLDALLDGELSPSDAAAVQQHLGECSACARAFEQLRAASHWLREGLVHYQAPDVLKASIQRALREQQTAARPRRTVVRWLMLAAAGVAIAVASSAITYAVARRGSRSASVAGEVLASHIRSLMPGHLIDVASNDTHNVKPWFDGRVNLSPAVPPLDSANFVLVGGRLDYVDSHAAAVVVYRRRQHVINVYSWPESGADEATRQTSSNGYHLVYWRRAGIEYWAASDLNPAELAQFVALYARAGP